MLPRLQVALDVLDGDLALTLAQAVAPFADILEAGTPLIKSSGIAIVTRLKESHPDKLVVADMKSSDVGAYEAEMALRAGADIVTTLGITTDATIEAVCGEAARWGRRAEVDLTGVPDPVARTRHLATRGVDLVLVHRSIDEQVYLGKSWDEAAVEVVRRLCTLKIDVGVAGGIDLGLLPAFRELPLYCIVAGRTVTGSPDPAAAAAAIASRILELWGP